MLQKFTYKLRLLRPQGVEQNAMLDVEVKHPTAAVIDDRAEFGVSLFCGKTAFFGIV